MNLQISFWTSTQTARLLVWNLTETWTVTSKWSSALCYQPLTSKNQTSVLLKEGVNFSTFDTFFSPLVLPAFVHLKCSGLRFGFLNQVLSIRTTCNGVKYAKVRIQPEVNLPPPMHAVRFYSLDRLRLKPVTPADAEDDETQPSAGGWSTWTLPTP